MSFVADGQSLADLNLTGKYKANSVFNLFNKVKTTGGERLLEEMFSSPLSDAGSIRRRSDSIKCLHELDITLQAERTHVDQAIQYLEEAQPGSLLSSITGCFTDWVQDTVYGSDRQKRETDQIFAVGKTLDWIRDLQRQLNAHSEKLHPLAIHLESLNAALSVLTSIEIGDRALPVAARARLRFLLRNKCRKQIQELFVILHELDVYITVARIAKKNAMTYPEILQEKDRVTMINVVDLKHPQLKSGVGNTMTLDDSSHLFFLTGANMAGKSTWMKTLGVSFYLAHMGFPVAAKHMQFRVMDGIFTSINVPDQVSKGWSHFYAEVMRVKAVAEQLHKGKRLFVLFDELFKGTNVNDAYDATLAITERLAKYSSCAFVISTHIIEVGQVISGIPGIQFGYMPTIMENGVPRYTYRLEPGITTDRQGMIILENEKILEILYSGTSTKQNESILRQTDNL